MYAPKISFEFEPFVFDTYEGVNLIEGAGYGANFMSRYYFSPRSENDGLSLATYTSGGLNDAEPFVILGALAGYKFINYKNFTASAELGFGKEIIQPKSNFDDSAILLIKLSAGYYIERGK
jgi:hypothetical protein